eukprot:scaffold48549_cov27-Tisochrysis_lutea.AAC.1
MDLEQHSMIVPLISAVPVTIRHENINSVSHAILKQALHAGVVFLTFTELALGYNAEPCLLVQTGSTPSTSTGPGLCCTLNGRKLRHRLKISVYCMKCGEAAPAGA